MEDRSRNLSVTRLVETEPIISGAASRWATINGVAVGVVRVCLLALSTVAGLGIVLYWLMWRRNAVDPMPSGQTEAADGRQVSSPYGDGQSLRRSLGVVAATSSILVLGGSLGITLGTTSWVVLLIGLGCAIAWNAPRQHPQRSKSSADHRGLAWVNSQLIAGTILGVIGALVGVTSQVRWTDFVVSLVIVAVVIGAVGLVVVPVVQSAIQEAQRERIERVRSVEREEVAAHLHDSVLQTLTLIQRYAADGQDQPRMVAALARRQERDLRRWLYGRSAVWDPGSRLRDSFESLAAEIEDLYGVTIEAVIVGDVDMSTQWEPILGATREALTNAAKFAPDDLISLYVECQSHPAPVTPLHDNHETTMVHGVQVFVRDRGAGIPWDEVPDDRRGIRDSIRARMERVGGTVRIASSPGEGTEIELSLGAIQTNDIQERPEPSNEPSVQQP